MSTWAMGNLFQRRIERAERALGDLLDEFDAEIPEAERAELESALHHLRGLAMVEHALHQEALEEASPVFN